MALTPLLAAYRALPSFLRTAFAHGSSGMHARLNALNASLENIFKRTNGNCSEQDKKLCADLLSFAFETMPLDGTFAAQLLKAVNFLPHISDNFLALPLSLTDPRQLPANADEITGLANDCNGAALAEAVEKGLKEAGHDMFWMRHALYAAAFTGDAAWLASLKIKTENVPPAPASLMRWFSGMADWFQQKYESALYNFNAAPIHWPGLEEMIGHCLCKLDQTEEALFLWRSIIEKRPWHVNLIRTMYDRARRNDVPLRSIPASAAVLLYSWNKAADLNRTLEALSASLDDIAIIICLDNGSSDSTSEVLGRWAGLMGTDRFKTVSLPVNIGAAAARNWLSSMPEVRACEYAAFLDDDVAVEPSWLRHLFKAAQIFPGASSYGCRVVNADSPWIIQSGPLHVEPLFAPLPGAELLPGQTADAEPADSAYSPYRAYGEPFNVYFIQGVGFDLADAGQLDFISPCVSVTGCCHLFKTADLVERKGFSLNLSPSQYDDLEFDLRAASSGRLACYSGFCSVLHSKRTGGGHKLSGPAFGNALGNKYKLHALYDAAQISETVEMEAGALEKDILKRLEELDKLF